MVPLWPLTSKEKTIKLETKLCQRKRKFSQNDNLLQQPVWTILIATTWIKFHPLALCSQIPVSAKIKTTHLHIYHKSLLVPMMLRWKKIEMLNRYCQSMCSLPNTPIQNLLLTLKWHLQIPDRPPTAPQLSPLNRKADSKTDWSLSKKMENKYL